MIKVKPRTKLFPTHFNLVLDAAEHAALDTLFDLDPSLKDERELLHQALRAGIKALNPIAEARRKDPQQLSRTEVESTKRAGALQEDDGPLAFPKHVELDLTEDQIKGLQELADRLPHTNDAELTSKVLSRGIDIVREENARTLSKPKQVENYVGFPLESRVRRKLEDFLRAFPGTMPEEEIYALLLDLGMDQANAMRFASRSCRMKLRSTMASL